MDNRQDLYCSCSKRSTRWNSEIVYERLGAYMGYRCSVCGQLLDERAIMYGAAIDIMKVTDEILFTQEA